MSKYILETNELTKVFGKQKAVNNVSLKIEENSVYGLLGPNGAGKSTTLKMITGMLHKTSGEIMFEGHEWSRNDLSDIGALIEMPPLYENLSARENLKVRTLLLGLPDARIDEVLEIVTSNGKKTIFAPFQFYSVSFPFSISLIISLKSSGEILSFFAKNDTISRNEFLK